MLLVITDGERFGNVVSCQAIADNREDEMMMLSPFGEALAQDDDEEGEDSKPEYNSTLLLGDRGLSDWLQLFSQQALGLMRQSKAFKETKSLLLTMAVPLKLKQAPKGDQFTVLRDLTKLLKDVL